LSLAGNILKAIGGTSDLCSKNEKEGTTGYPVYPYTLPKHVPMTLHLGPISDSQLDQFILFEKPSPFFSAVSLENNSVGEIYDFISEALRCKTVEFHPESQKFQFGPGEAYAPKVKDAGGDVYVKKFGRCS